MKKDFIGIDISKKKLDVWIHSTQTHKIFENNSQGFTQMLQWVCKQLPDSSATVFCMEHTGKYDVSLCLFLQSETRVYYKVSALRVRRSMGIKRGKSDKVDARELARYAYLFQEELKGYQMPTPRLRNLKQLLAHRAKLVRQRAAHKASLKENQQVLGAEASQWVQQSSSELVSILSLQIKQTEIAIRELLQNAPELQHTFELLNSIPGVGFVIAATMIVQTENFQRFDNPRKFACFAAIAPFEHTSGSSIRGKTRISGLGNRQIKTLLSSAASIAIVHNKELKAYYQRRLKQNKNKRSTLNVVRNKIVQRMFAVVKRGTPYVDLYKFAA
jgi:transposase